VSVLAAGAAYVATDRLASSRQALPAISPAAHGPENDDEASQARANAQAYMKLLMEAANADPRKTASGQFLASHFAQSRSDWKKANDFLSGVLHNDPAQYDLVKRSMILAMGTGDLPLAVLRAKFIVNQEPHDGLALLIMTVNAIAEDHMTLAQTYLDAMESGDVTDYIRPLLYRWTQATAGPVDLPPADPNNGTMTLFHNALLALFQKDDARALSYIDAALSLPALTATETERAADIMLLAGAPDKALLLYQGLLPHAPDKSILVDKIAALSGAGEPDLASPLFSPLHVESPAQGVALAMADMATLLFQEQSDNSARLFAYMALTLNPRLTDVDLMLASVAARMGRYDEAIAHLEAVPANHPHYLDSRRAVADLMAESGRREKAAAALNDLFAQYGDIESLIRLGDLYREEEDYDDALTTYNRAADAIGGAQIPEKYWHLLYARGMAYERQGLWDKAESDLKAALAYRPDHPYLLNYLGYGWADQGMNLKESLALIERAAALEPEDGYITDSLGWVYYMMGRYADAVPPLERAVALLPYDATLNDHLGDAYWQVGRKLEARFQWERAINNAEDTPEGRTLAQTIQAKLRHGLEDDLPHVQEAKNFHN
ncbi:MAG: tetratricopeptide repeat protein, partial [Alphaproteobacteria bacterium]|nr:tetratricopeptide repeat protein [Alphaproteobacteria bacterium]